MNTSDRNVVTSSRSDAIGVALVGLYLVGIYTYIVLSVGAGTPWPAPISSVCGLLLLLKNRDAVRASQVAPIMIFIGIAIFSTIFAPGPFEFMEDRLKSLINLIHALVIGFGLYVELSQWQRRTVTRLFLYATLALLVGAALENYTPFKILSDGFRTSVFPAEINYNRDTRDETLFFAIRPKLFTSEPSHLAKYLLLFATVWLTLARGIFRFVIFLGIVAAGFFLVRSPILMLGVPILLLNAVLASNHEQYQSKFSGQARFTLVCVFLIVGAAIFILAANTILANRLALLFGGGGDDSFTVRTFGPAIITRNTILVHPFFGAGLGGNESVMDIIIAAYSPIINYQEFFDTASITIGNVFWVHWMYFGAVGGILSAGALYAMVRVLAPRNSVYALLTMIIFAQTMGAYVAPRFWTFVFLVLVAARVSEKPMCVTLRRNSLNLGEGYVSRRPAILHGHVG